MKKIILLVCVWCTFYGVINSYSQRPKSGLIGNRYHVTVPDSNIYVVIILAQSNGVGRAQSARIANPYYNYKGIATYYPDTSTIRGRYVTRPNNTYIYFKDQSKSANHNLDNGQWRLDTAGVNSATDNTRPEFGLDIPLGTYINDSTSKKVFFIKAAWGDTRLTDTTSSDATVGTWNNTNRNLASYYYISRGIRDLRTLYPTKRIVLVSIIWWQGEADANLHVTKSAYKTAFVSLKSFIETNLKQDLWVTGNTPNWQLVKINFYQTVYETLIRDALTELSDELYDVDLIDIDAYPQKEDLTNTVGVFDESSPLAKGSPINADGGDDDRHQSYIAQFAAAEKIGANIRRLIR